MLQESRACIITNIGGIRRDLDARKPTIKENQKKISRSISNLDAKKLRAIYESK
jgi:hypothetical protein